MTTIQLYRKHKAGEIGRDRFLYEVRRDKNLPWVTNITSYDDAVKILKNKGIISEADANVQTDPAVDKVNPYFLKRGVNMLLSKEKELDNDSYINALNKAAKALEKDSHAYDEEMFANTADVEKADAKLEMEEVKKKDFNDTDNEMKKVKVKSLKEAALKELTDSLKKKDSIQEDVHWNHTVGSNVHTPDGEGTVKEIVGGTLTVELENGSQKDFQINTIDHFTQKAREVEPETGASKDDVKQIWANWDKQAQKPFAGMIADPETFKKPLDMSKIKQYMEMYKHDKEKMGKLKEVLKKLKETKALVVPKTATGVQIDKMVASDPTIKPGQQIDILRK